jgi:hypothetical protein
MYLAAGFLRQLYNHILDWLVFYNKDLVNELNLPPVPEEISSWEEVERTVKDLPALMQAALAEISNIPPSRRDWLILLWCEMLAAAYLQMRFSRDSAPALQNYLAYRAQEMAPGRRPFVYSAWSWWRYLRDLAKSIITALEETERNFVETYQTLRRDADAKSTPLLHWALTFILNYNPPQEYEEMFDILSPDSLRMVLRWARFDFQDFYQAAAAELLEEAQRQVRSAMAGVAISPPEISLQAPPEWSTAHLAEEVKGNISETVSIQSLGLTVGAAEVYIIDDKEGTFLGYYLILSPTAEVGKKIIGLLTDLETEFGSQRVGGSLAFITFTDKSGYRRMCSSVGTSIESAFAELLRSYLIQPQDDQSRLDFLSDLLESGLLQKIPLLSNAIEWLHRVEASPDGQMKNWKAVEQFLLDYFNRQKEQPIEGPQVRQALMEWIEKAKKILNKYGNLEQSPNDADEARRFEEDVRMFAVETERMLSMLHGGGGLLVALTPSGTYTDLFNLLRVRTGLTLVRTATGYYRYEGDKKLLLKWLILRGAVA